MVTNRVRESELSRWFFCLYLLCRYNEDRGKVSAFSLMKYPLAGLVLKSRTPLPLFASTVCFPSDQLH